MVNATDSKTGTLNAQYDLISTLYHMIEGITTYDQYIVDAQGENDSELASFFEGLKSQHKAAANQAKELLKSRM